MEFKKIFIIFDLEETKKESYYLRERLKKEREYQLKNFQFKS